MKTKEIWKDIPGYEGHYQASTLGKIRSLSREIRKKNNSIKRMQGQLMTLQLSINGYLVIGLKRDKEFKKFKVHRLVAATFLGYDLNDKSKVINHINFIKIDNRLLNLEIITQRENSNKSHLESTSKFTGVYKYVGHTRWTARIYVNKERYTLGSFDTEEEANSVYQTTLKNYLEKGILPIRKDNSSKHKGVTWDKRANKWKSFPSIDGKQTHLGYFSSEDEAYQAIVNFKLKI